MLSSFRRIVVTTYHIVMMECASGTSKRLGADIGHLKASWDFLGDGESVDHIVMRNVSICVMVTDTWGSIDGVDNFGRCDEFLGRKRGSVFGANNHLYREYCMPVQPIQ